MTAFDTSIMINAPLKVVYGYISNGLNLKFWNSAVQEVHQEDEGRYVIMRELPNGPAKNTISIQADPHHNTIEICTLDGPTPFDYQYSLTETGEGTKIAMSGEYSMGGLADKLSFATVHFVKRGVNSNLKTLKSLLE